MVGAGGQTRFGHSNFPTPCCPGKPKRIPDAGGEFKKKITHLLVERKGCCYSQWEAYLFLCMKVFLNTGNYKNHYPVNQHGKAYGC